MSNYTVEVPRHLLDMVVRELEEIMALPTIYKNIDSAEKVKQYNEIINAVEALRSALNDAS